MSATTARILVVTILALTVGCATSSASKNSTDNASVPAEEVEPPGPGYLVQLETDEGVETVWLEAGANRYEVIARRSGAVAVVEDSLWEWASASIEHDLKDCECVQKARESGEEPAADACRETTTVEVPSLEQLDGSKRLLLTDVEGYGGSGDISISAQNLGSVGEYWFGSACTFTYFCGAAHGNVSCNAFVADLREQTLMAPSDLLGDKELAIAETELRRIAVQQFEDRPSDATMMEEPGDAALVAAWPRVGEGGTAFVYLYSAPTCYACSDGSWSSYTVAKEVLTDDVPEQLAALASPPPSVVDFLKSKTIANADTTSWSRLPESAETRRELLEIFEDFTAP